MGLASRHNDCAEHLGGCLRYLLDHGSALVAYQILQFSE